MENDPDPLPDDPDEELLLRLEASLQQTAELSQQTAELSRQAAESSRKLAETAMARITGQRRIDLRALKSLDMKSGNYQITVSEPEDPQPSVTLTWIPGQLILGVDLIPTNRDVHLPLPSVRQPRSWSIPPPRPGQISPPHQPLQPDQMSVSERLALSQQHQARKQAWESYHRVQLQAATRYMNADQAQARQHEEQVAEAMMAEIEARRENPKVNANRTIMEVGERTAAKVLELSRSVPD